MSRAHGETQALAGVDLACRSGEVVGLMGANGAGKLTLVKILSGITNPHPGTITLEGTAIAPGTPAEAQRTGIVAVHQSIADADVAIPCSA